MKNIPLLNSITTGWHKLSDRDRKILIIGGVAVTLILVVKLAVLPILTWQEDLSSSLNYNRLMLKKMTKTIKSKPQLEQELKQLQKSKARSQSQLFQAKNADMASADLIKAVRALAKKAGIDTSRISTAKGRAKDSFFQDLTVSIPSIRCDMIQLYNFMVNIRNAPQLLTIKELRIRVTNMKNPREVSVNMEIVGYMVKSQDKENESTEET